MRKCYIKSISSSHSSLSNGISYFSLISLLIALFIFSSLSFAEPIQLWNKTFGGSSTDIARSVTTDSSNNILVAGYTNSFGTGNYDFWVIKLDSNGNHLWNKTFGGPYDDLAYSITTDSSNNNTFRLKKIKVHNKK